MKTTSRRYTKVVDSPFPHEREGLLRLAEPLPDADPYRIWSSCRLVQGTRSYDVDAIVVGRHCVYVVELKAWEGEIRGDALDWYLTRDGRESYRENPVRLTEIKAKVLSSLLAQHWRGPGEKPWVEPLVFLSHDPKLRLAPSARQNVVVGAEIGRAITHRAYPGAPDRPDIPLSRPTQEAIERAIAAIGLKESEKNRRFGEYVLQEQLEDGEDHQEFLATRRDFADKDEHYRLRVFPTELVPAGPQREHLRHLARREEMILREVGQHPRVLRAHPGFESPRGPAIPLEHLPDAVPLGRWLETHANASRDDRLHIIQQIGDALAYCHERRVIHRGLSPDAILVTGDRAPEVRLRNFGAARRAGTSGSLTGSLGRAAQAPLYRAPEAHLSLAEADVPADVFSLGALAFLVLSGKAPAADTAELLRRVHEGPGLHLRAVADGFGPEPTSAAQEEGSADAGPPTGRSKAIDEVVAIATDPEAPTRWSSVRDFLDALLDAATAPAPPEAAEAPAGLARAVDPLDARPGDDLGPGGIVEKPLGSGATSVVYLVRIDAKGGKDGQRRVLKVSRDPRAADLLEGEARTLDGLKHQRIVALKGAPIDVLGHRAILLDMAGETTLSRYLREEGAVKIDFAARWGKELLETVQYLEERGIHHRDLKPANIGIEVVGANRTRSILLFDFSHSHLPLTSIDCGTEAYRDPHLPIRGRWDHHAEHYSAALVLYEMLTGTLPERPRALRQPARVAADALVEGWREPLTRFFERALAVDAKDRFPSAQEMLQAWATATAEPGDRARVPATSLASVTERTPLYELDISTRAKNVLDREKIYSAGDLARFPRNRLLVLRGVGRATAEELKRLSRDLREHLRVEDASAPPAAFAPGHPDDGEPLPEAIPGVPAKALERLLDAGLETWKALADAAPEAVAVAVPDEPAQKALLTALDKRRHAKDLPPTTRRGWVDHARREVPGKKREHEALDLLLGLVPFEAQGKDGKRAPLTFDRVPSQIELAKSRGMIQPELSRFLEGARRRWAKGRVLGLTHRIARLLHGAGGALPLAALVPLVDAHIRGPGEAAALPGAPTATPPGAPAGASEAPLREAAFLVRVAVETAYHEDPQPLRRRRAPDGAEVIEAVPGIWDEVRALAERADALAQETPLPSAQRAAGAILAEVETRGIADLLDASPPPRAPEGAPPEPPPDRTPAAWLRTAILAAKRAALSRRGELYPRDLAPERLLELLGASLPPELTREDLVREVRERFPDASAALPERPALDALLDARRYVFADGSYRRRGEVFDTYHRTSQATRTPGPVASRPAASAVDADARSGEHGSPLDEFLLSDDATTSARPAAPRAQDTGPSRPVLADGYALTRTLIDERISIAAREKCFRACMVAPSRAERAARRLTALVEHASGRAPIAPRSLDLGIVRALRATLPRELPELDTAEAWALANDADAGGPGTPNFDELRPYVERAAKDHLDALLNVNPKGAPLVLRDVGLVARFGLTGFLEALVRAAEEDPRAGPVFLLVPQPDAGATPRINDLVEVPVTPGQALRLSSAWVQEEGEGAGGLFEGAQ